MGTGASARRKRYALQGKISDILVSKCFYIASKIKLAKKPCELKLTLFYYYGSDWIEKSKSRDKGKGRDTQLTPSGFLETKN